MTVTVFQGANGGLNQGAKVVFFNLQGAMAPVAPEDIRPGRELLLRSLDSALALGSLDPGIATVPGTGTVECQIKPHAATLRSGKWLNPNVAAPPVSQAFGHVESSRLVPRGAHSSPITIQQKHYHRTTG